MKEKIDALRSYLSGLESVLVCCSGGADSTLLLALCRDTVKAEAVFFNSQAVPAEEAREALRCAGNAVLHGVYIDITAVSGMKDNPENRCYICKHEILSRAKALAAQRGLRYVAEGSHADDAKEARPGRQAIRELGVLSPFEAVGVGKSDIRAISKTLGLQTWDKPSFSCLLTRLPHGEAIREADLRLAEQGERLLRGLGMRNLRFRHRGDTALIELGEADALLYSANSLSIEAYIKGLGYKKVLLGHRA